MAKGFIQLNRGSAILPNLLMFPNEMHLLTIIAIRASRTGNEMLGLKPCQAIIGDYKHYGLSRQNYRTAVKNLVKWHLITIEPTTKGTIATLCSSDIWNINPIEPNHQSNPQVTNSQPSSNHQVTTINKENKDNNANSYSDDADRILQIYPRTVGHQGKLNAMPYIQEAIDEAGIAMVARKTNAYREKVEAEGMTGNDILAPLTFFRDGYWRNQIVIIETEFDPNKEQEMRDEWDRQQAKTKELVRTL